MSKAYILFEDQSSDGVSNSFSLSQAEKQYIIISGVTDGCNIQIEMNSPNFTDEWVNVDGGLFSDVTGAFTLDRIFESSLFRARLSNSGAGTLINVEITK